MDTEKKYKWALSGLVVMILLNAVTLFTIWWDKPDNRDWRQHRGEQKERGHIHQFMKKELELSPEQADSIASLRRRHFQEIRSLREELSTTRRAYYDHIMSPESDNPKMQDSLLNDLTEQYIQIEQSLYQHMSEMKTILDSSQQQKFNRLMKETFLRSRGNEDRRGPNKRQ